MQLKLLKIEVQKKFMFTLLMVYLSGEAVKKIKNSVIKNLVITDTIDNVHKS